MQKLNAKRGEFPGYQKQRKTQEAATVSSREWNRSVNLILFSNSSFGLKAQTCFRTFVRNILLAPNSSLQILVKAELLQPDGKSAS